MSAVLLAVAPSAEVGLHGTAGGPDLAAGVAAGLGMERGPLGLFLVGQVDRSAGWSTEVRPELRLRVTPAGPRTLWAVVGAGLGLPQPHPVGSVGVALRLAQTQTLDVRLESRYRFDPNGPGGLQVGVAVQWGRRPAPIEPDPVVDPIAVVEAKTGAGTLEMDPALAEVATVWVPHPICTWLSVDEANALLDDLPPGTELTVAAPGYLPASVPVDGVTAVSLQPAPSTGGLVVGAWPGDAVIVDGVEVAVGDDGLAVLNRQEGFVPIEVSGGGRHFETEVAVARNHTLWARVPEPEPVHVRFGLDSAVLSPTAKAAIAEVADHAGEWGFTVQGGASPEGSLEHNLALADRRADAVVAALVDAGVDPAAIRTLPANADGDGDPEALRAATITPVKR